MLSRWMALSAAAATAGLEREVALAKVVRLSRSITTRKKCLRLPKVLEGRRMVLGETAVGGIDVLMSLLWRLREEEMRIRKEALVVASVIVAMADVIVLICPLCYAALAGHGKG